MRGAHPISGGSLRRREGDDRDSHWGGGVWRNHLGNLDQPKHPAEIRVESSPRGEVLRDLLGATGGDLAQVQCLSLNISLLEVEEKLVREGAHVCARDMVNQL